MDNIIEKDSLLFKSYIVVIVTYIIAIIIGFYMTLVFKELHPIITIGIADIVATIVVFLFSFIFNNSSLYDPYWSIAPIPIAIFYLLNSNGNINTMRTVIVITLISIWAIRLTYNWTRGWKGLNHEDWRYVNFRESSGKLYWLVSFFGIMLFPTLIVFAGCLPLYVVFLKNVNGFDFIDILAVIVTLSAIIIEGISDYQMRKYTKKVNRKSTETIKQGLWKYSRHPNYFGEVLFWWGLYVFVLASNPSKWWVIIGPVLMVLLFVFISIPMIEKRMKKRRSNYEDYIKTTSPLIFWFPSKK